MRAGRGPRGDRHGGKPVPSSGVPSFPFHCPPLSPSSPFLIVHVIRRVRMPLLFHILPSLPFLSILVVSYSSKSSPSHPRPPFPLSFPSSLSQDVFRVPHPTFSKSIPAFFHEMGRVQFYKEAYSYGLGKGGGGKGNEGMTTK